MSTDGLQPVGIFWDIENCAVPHGVSAEEVAVHIRRTFKVYLAMQGPIRVFSAYADFSLLTRNVRQGCQKTGVSLIDVPHCNKDAADKAILADMFLFALDHPPPCTILLITGDVDFAPTLHKLGQRGYCIVLAIPSGLNVSPALCNACQHLLSWPDVAGGKGIGSLKTPSTRITSDAKPIGMHVPNRHPQYFRRKNEHPQYFRRKNVSFMNEAHGRCVTGFGRTQDTSEVTGIPVGISEEQVKIPFDTGKELKEIPLAEEVASHGTCGNAAASTCHDMNVGETNVSKWFDKTSGGSDGGPLAVPCMGEWKSRHKWKCLEQAGPADYEQLMPRYGGMDEAVGVCNMGHESANREAKYDRNGSPHGIGPVTRSPSACKKSKPKGPSVQLKVKKKETKKKKGEKTAEAEKKKTKKKKGEKIVEAGKKKTKKHKGEKIVEAETLKLSRREGKALDLGQITDEVKSFLQEQFICQSTDVHESI